MNFVVVYSRPTRPKSCGGQNAGFAECSVQQEDERMTCGLLDELKEYECFSEVSHSKSGTSVV